MTMAATDQKDLEVDNLGYTLLESCINVKSIEDSLKELLEQYESACPLPWTGGGKWFGHVNYYPSPSCQIIREITANSRVKNILDHALGKDYKIIGFCGNVNLPGSR